MLAWPALRLAAARLVQASVDGHDDESNLKMLRVYTIYTIYTICIIYTIYTIYTIL